MNLRILPTMRICTSIVAAALSCFVPVAIGQGKAIRLDATDAKVSGPNLKVAQGTPITASGGISVPLVGPAFLTGFHDPADRAAFYFKVKQPGIYQLRVCYRADHRRGYDISVDGLAISGMLEAWPAGVFGIQTVGEVELSAGQNEIDVNNGWGFYDVEYLELVPAGPIVPPVRPADRPSDPQISPAAAALLTKLDDAYGKTTMLGVYKDRDADYVLATTGALPSIMGGDLIDYSPQRALHQKDPATETERLIARAKDGYTITLSWHWSSPSGAMDTQAEPWWKSFYTEATTFDVAKALADPTSKDYALLLSDIDTIAVQLKKLQDANVPVLWRPLHEAEGRWFWWGAKGPKPFVQLWQLLYTRLTKVDGIHNLLWVYTSGGDPAWYPGDAYVDVVGIDAYPKDLRDPQNALWAQLEKQFTGHKPVTISEFGGVPDVPRMQRMGEYWSYAVSWSDREGPKKNTPDELKRIYTSPGVATMAAPAPASPGNGGTPVPVPAPAPGR